MGYFQSSMGYLGVSWPVILGYLAFQAAPQHEAPVPLQALAARGSGLGGSGDRRGPGHGVGRALDRSHTVGASRITWNAK